MYNNYLTISQKKKIVLIITFISNETRSYKKTIQNKSCYQLIKIITKIGERT